MDTTPFAIEESECGELRQIRLQGELDLAKATRAEQVITQALDTNRSIELDLRGLTFIDSTGAQVVVTMCERSRHMGKLFSVVPGPPNVQRVFEILELAETLPFAYPLEDEETG